MRQTFPMMPGLESSPVGLGANDGFGDAELAPPAEIQSPIHDQVILSPEENRDFEDLTARTKAYVPEDVQKRVEEQQMGKDGSSPDVDGTGKMGETGNPAWPS